MNRNIRIIRIAAATVIAGAALLVVIHYRVGLAKWVLAGSVERSSDVHAAHTTAPAEKQILYYYDAMSPEHHYDKPGKSPDGMDLVPQYEIGRASCRERVWIAVVVVVLETKEV